MLQAIRNISIVRFVRNAAFSLLSVNVPYILMATYLLLEANVEMFVEQLARDVLLDAKTRFEHDFKMWLY